MKLLEHVLIPFLIFEESASYSSSDYTVLHSHQQCTRVPISPSVCQYLFSVLLIVATLMGVMSLSDRLVGKESACNAGNPGLIPGSGRAAREGTAALLAAAHSSILGLPTPVFLGCPLQYSWAAHSSILGLPLWFSR